MTQSQDSAGLNGRSVLVVEDEAIIAMMLEDMLSDLGCAVLGPAADIAEASEIARDDGKKPDVAILDVNVAGQPVYPVAEILAGRGVPVIFATGYGAGGVAEAWRDRLTVQKPYSQADVVRALKSALSL